MATFLKPQALENWIPNGYKFVTDPEHILLPDDCCMPQLSNDRRFVRTINDGIRIGKAASSQGADIQYFITKT